MQLAKLFQDLNIVAFVQVKVNEFSNEKLYRRPLLLLDGGSVRWIDIVKGVLNENLFLWAEVLSCFLAMEGFKLIHKSVGTSIFSAEYAYEGTHSRVRLCISQQISSAIL